MTTLDLTYNYGVAIRCCMPHGNSFIGLLIALKIIEDIACELRHRAQWEISEREVYPALRELYTTYNCPICQTLHFRTTPLSEAFCDEWKSNEQKKIAPAVWPIPAQLPPFPSSDMPPYDGGLFAFASWMKGRWTFTCTWCGKKEADKATIEINGKYFCCRKCEFEFSQHVKL